jgi:hypothetical protein
MPNDSDLNDLTKGQSNMSGSEQTEQETQARFKITVHPDCKPLEPTPAEKGWHDDRFGGDPNKE